MLRSGPVTWSERFHIANQWESGIRVIEFCLMASVAGARMG